MPIREGEEWKSAQTGYAPDTPEERDALLARANEGIQSHRTGTCTRTLLQPDGSPLAHTDVRCRLLRHAFPFGFAFTAGKGDHRDPGSRARRDALLDLFNHATITCYWNEHWDIPIEPRQGRRETRSFLDRLDILEERGLSVKGHPLVWTVRKALPDWLLRYPPEKRMLFQEHHVRSMIACAEGRVAYWDLCNEMLWEPSLRHATERVWPHLETPEEILTYLEPAVHWAREEAPRAVLSINEYGLTGSCGGIPSARQRERMLALTALMRERGCLPDAIGHQCHDGVVPLRDICGTLDHLAESGLPVQITEFMYGEEHLPGHGTRPPEEMEEVHAGYIRDVLTLAFGHPSVSLFTFWSAARMLLQEDGTPRPAYEAVRALLRGRWSTDVVVRTDAAGRLSFRGFHGEYAFSPVADPAREVRSAFTDTPEPACGVHIESTQTPDADSPAAVLTLP